MGERPMAKYVPAENMQKNARRERTMAIFKLT
jgi:hypothetical protein